MNIDLLAKEGTHLSRSEVKDPFAIDVLEVSVLGRDRPQTIHTHMTVPLARVMTTLDQAPPYRMSLVLADFQNAGRSFEWSCGGESAMDMI